MPSATPKRPQRAVTDAQKAARRRRNKLSMQKARAERAAAAEKDPAVAEAERWRREERAERKRLLYKQKSAKKVSVKREVQARAQPYTDGTSLGEPEPPETLGKVPLLDAAKFAAAIQPGFLTSLIGIAAMLRGEPTAADMYDTKSSAVWDTGLDPILYNPTSKGRTCAS